MHSHTYILTLRQTDLLFKNKEYDFALAVTLGLYHIGNIHPGRNGGGWCGFTHQSFFFFFKRFNARILQTSSTVLRLLVLPVMAAMRLGGKFCNSWVGQRLAWYNHRWLVGRIRGQVHGLRVVMQRLDDRGLAGWY